MPLPTTILSVDFDSSEEVFNEIYALPSGYVFRYTKNLESLLHRIQQDVPEGQVFTVRTVRPGTSLYTQYGDRTLVILDSGKIVPVPYMAESLVAWPDYSAGPYNYKIRLVLATALEELVEDTTNDTQLDVAAIIGQQCAGAYNVIVQNGVEDLSWSQPITFVIAHTPLELVLNGSSYEWSGNSHPLNPNQYMLQIATDANFTQVVETYVDTETSYTPTADVATHYARVKYVTQDADWSNVVTP